MRRLPTGSDPFHQRGWAGLLVLLLALVIVAWLAKDALQKYGLVPSAGTVTQRAGVASPSPKAEGGGAAVAPPAPRTPMDAARGLEGFVKQQEDKRAGGN
ncbi:MAG: hypothetical protein U1F10_16930 [Burkholderiales bacterium]